MDLWGGGAYALPLCAFNFPLTCTLSAKQKTTIDNK